MPPGQAGHRSAPTRLAFVTAPRLAGWVDRFAAGHGRLQEENVDDGLQLTAVDGAMALLTPPWPRDGRPGRGANGIERLASLASQERSLGLILVRRGGYAVAVVTGGKVTSSKTGNRYVQSRSAAGGSSQQRFARRRANQADALVEDVAEHAARIFNGHAIEYIVPGGDRNLAVQVLSRPALAGYARCTRLPFLATPDPNTKILQQAAQEACSIRIQVTDPVA
ncbi:acVLRF1 family peptidyl-tRNA hydrolase [Arthrobacter sp. ISL-30]|uniref:acVLRF1 family peptidyl-tRNA hydrolase n=1 Tax=Arthrobacter sp. ISL-30 TaxID=2819109 RepID=UPI001BE629C4|nr:hypothetical protein [Arthrobacter sp. ISL-30]